MAFVDQYLIPLMWASAFVMGWSLLYRENFAFRVAEHLTIGLFLGFTITEGLNIIWTRVIQAYPDFAAGTITGIAFVAIMISAILGVISWFRLYEPTQWLARWPIATLASIGTAIAVRGAVEAQIIRQLSMPNWAAGGMDTINAILITVGTLTVISYFLFTQRQEGPLYVSALIGRITMMISFGTMLGLFLMSNIAFAVGQMLALTAWPGIIVSIIAVLCVAYDIYGPGWPGPWAPKEE